MFTFNAICQVNIEGVIKQSVVLKPIESDSV